MRLPALLAALLLGSCQGQGQLTVVDPDATGAGVGTGAGTGTGSGTGTGGGGGCGDVRTWAMDIRGSVETAGGAPAAFADVWIEDRGWNPTVTVMGAAVAEFDGTFQIAAPEIVDVEDCWGSLLDYVLVAELGPGFAERDLNSSLYSAILDQSLTVDLPPLQLQGP